MAQDGQHEAQKVQCKVQALKCKRLADEHIGPAAGGRCGGETEDTESAESHARLSSATEAACCNMPSLRRFSPSCLCARLCESRVPQIHVASARTQVSAAVSSCLPAALPWRISCPHRTPSAAPLLPFLA